MISTNQTALICDLAEVYGVLDYKDLPAELLATLAAGLRDDSRIKMSMSGRTVTRMETLLAAAVDRLTNIAWLLGGVCPMRPDPPGSILKVLLGQEDDTEEQVGFDTPEEYEAEWRRRTGVGHGER